MTDYEPQPLPDWPPTGWQPGHWVEWPPESAGHYMDRDNTLQTIASAIVGSPVRVFWQLERHIGGRVFFHFGWRIFINPAIAATELGRVLFHEIGHIACGHIEPRTITPEIDVDEEHPLTIWRAKAESAPPGDVSKIVLACVEQEEQEADAWGNRALAEFEAQYGPFLDVLSGKV